MPIASVGFIGLGTMGLPMARNILEAGFGLAVYDVRPEAVRMLADDGAVVCGSCREVADRSEAIVSIVPDVEQVEQIMLGVDGVLEAAKAGSLIVEMSTIDPQTSKKIARAAANKSVRFLDAPVCRSSRHAEQGKLMILVGGSRQDYEDSLPLLRSMGDTFYHCGDVGAGITMKLVNNAMGQAICQAMCECLTVGVKAGLDLDLMVNILSGTAASNKMMEAVYPASAFKGQYELGFALDWAHKDVGHALKLAASLNVPCPAVSAVHQFQSIARAQGKGRMDHSALLTVFEELAGVKVRSDTIQPAQF